MFPVNIHSDSRYCAFAMPHLCDPEDNYLKVEYEYVHDALGYLPPFLMGRICFAITFILEESLRNEKNPQG